MTRTGFNDKKLRHLARWVLFAFVVAWLNLVFQVPAHAAMMQAQSQMSMNHDKMVNCHCPPPLCETVVSMEDQAVDGASLSFADTIDFQVSFVQVRNDQHMALHASLNYERADFVYRESSPPPLLLTTTLLI